HRHREGNRRAAHRDAFDVTGRVLAGVLAGSAKSVRRISMVAFGALLFAPLQMVAASSDDVLDRYLHHIAAGLPEKVAEALQQIDGTPRRLLAVRAYLRAGNELPSRWSWST